MNDIYTDIIGEGYPLVLVHGYFGSSNMWCNQKKTFSKHFKVITPSLPGYGESYRLKSLSNIKDMAKAVIKITKENNISKFHLMGHSMGGMIVQEIVKISPKIVDKLILFGTGSIGDIPGRFEPIDVSRERLMKDGVKSTANRIAKTWFVDGDKAKNFYLCEEAYQNVNQETGDCGLVAMKNWRGIENLKDINQETLIIWGNLDKAYNYEQVKTLNENIKNSRLEIINGCSHNAHLENIEEFNNLVLNFLGK
jgi:2-hydroxy-6-oxonona-2,4-dienedioate hydrolase